MRVYTHILVCVCVSVGGSSGVIENVTFDYYLCDMMKHSRDRHNRSMAMRACAHKCCDNNSNKNNNILDTVGQSMPNDRVMIT